MFLLVEVNFASSPPMRCCSQALNARLARCSAEASENFAAWSVAAAALPA